MPINNISTTIFHGAKFRFCNTLQGFLGTSGSSIDGTEAASASFVFCREAATTTGGAGDSDDSD